MTLSGKGMFIWKVPNCEGGNPASIAAAAKTGGLSHVLVKIANGIFSYNIDPTTYTDLALPVVQTLKSLGIQAWGWHYVFGNDPDNEARIAIRRVQELNLDGYVINAEAEYLGKHQPAKRFMRLLREGLPDTPIALSSYRFPSYHPQLPWREFLEKCDYNMPQVYWMMAHNAGAQLRASIRQFQALSPFRPIIATGAAFSEHGWTPTPQDVSDFLKTAQAENLSGVNFWSWDQARRTQFALWQVIAGFPWNFTSPPVTLDIAQEYLLALNTHNPDQVLELYRENAVHVNAVRTILGRGSIRTWYETLFNSQLVNANFSLTGFSGSGSSRTLNWTATSSTGKVLDGKDTLGITNGKIAYHYTFFNKN